MHSVSPEARALIADYLATWLTNAITTLSPGDRGALRADLMRILDVHAPETPIAPAWARGLSASDRS